MTGSFSGGDSSAAQSALLGLIPEFQQGAIMAANLEPNFLDLASKIEGLFPQFQDTSTQLKGQAQDIMGPAQTQYAAGAAGVLTPAQRAAVDLTKQQMDTQTRTTYGNLGIGGSTMQSQDLGANARSSLAQEQGFSTLDEELGLKGLGTGLNFTNAGTSTLSAGLQDLLGAGTETTGALSTLTGAGQILGGASGSASNAITAAQNQQQLQMQALGGLGSAIGGSNGIFSSGGLFGSSGPFSSGGIFGSLFGGGIGATADDILGTTAGLI